tara:strand:+ start:483 stop:920 length:438 start_codon:yes stop_codon:yes gene_type:complete
VKSDDTRLTPCSCTQSHVRIKAGVAARISAVKATVVVSIIFIATTMMGDDVPDQHAPDKSRGHTQSAPTVATVVDETPPTGINAAGIDASSRSAGLHIARRSDVADHGMRLRALLDAQYHRRTAAAQESQDDDSGEYAGECVGGR